MKNKLTLIAISLMTFGINSSVLASSGNVRFTVHNMSNNNIQSQGLDVAERKVYAATESQVCVFCHTPHNAQPASPLWNKASQSGAATSFKMYTSSATLTATARAASLPAGSPSLLCLSCHDGKTAINVLHNASGTSAPAPYNSSDKVVDIGSVGSGPLALQNFAMGYQGSANLGGTATDYYAGDNLTDDHPIGFSYTAAQSDATHVGKLFDLTTVNTKSSGAVRFFGATSRIECSTCHDPHVNYSARGTGSNPALRPFLVMDNSGSKLCLSCHNK